MSASVIASILPALLATVDLSITKPSDYHYVAIPDEMTNTLEGVGMGADAPTGGDVPLRYEDKAFLMEAFAERCGYTSATPTNPVSVSEVVGFPILSNYGGHTPANSNKCYVSWPAAFIDPGLEVESGVRANDNSITNIDYLCEFLGTTNIAVASEFNRLVDEEAAWINEVTAGMGRFEAFFYKSSTALDTKWGCALYADLAKLTRIRASAKNPDPDTPRANVGYKVSLWGASDRGYYYDGGWTPQDRAYSSPTTSSVYTASFGGFIYYSVSKEKKARFRRGDDGNWAAQGQPASFGKYNYDYDYYVPKSSTYVFDTGIKSLGGRKLSNGILFCDGYVSTSLRLNDAKIDESSGRVYFHAGFPVEFEDDGTNVWAIFDSTVVGATRDESASFAMGVCSVLGLPFYKSPTELLNDTEDAPQLTVTTDWLNKNAADDEDGIYGDSSDVVSSYMLHWDMDAKGIICDVEFNARVKGDGGE